MVYDISFTLFSFQLQYSQCTLQIWRGSTYSSNGCTKTKKRKLKKKKIQHQDLLFLIAPIQKKIFFAFHADLLRSHTSYPWLVTLTKISLVLPPLSLSASLETTDFRGLFNSFCCTFVTTKNMKYQSSVGMKSGTYCACLENWIPSVY